ESCRPPAFATLMYQLDHVSCSIPDQWTSNPSEVGHHQLAALRRVHQRSRVPRVRLNHLGYELLLDDVHIEGLAATVPPCAQLGSSGVVHTAGTPSRLDSILDTWHASARLAGMYRHADIRPRKIDS